MCRVDLAFNNHLVFKRNKALSAAGRVDKGFYINLESIDPKKFGEV
jgi:hypothetical protein